MSEEHPELVAEGKCLKLLHRYINTMSLSHAYTHIHVRTVHVHREEQQKIATM